MIMKLRFGSMDKYTVAEISYQNGYKDGYDQALNDAMAQKSYKDTAVRQAKWNMLKHELQHWGYSDWYSDTIDAVRTIVNEMSWGLVIRAIHKLRRKREKNND